MIRFLFFHILLFLLYLVVNAIAAARHLNQSDLARAAGVSRQSVSLWFRARAIIPVRSGAALKQKNISWGDVERNRIVKETHRLGKDAWKYGSGYTRRVLVETAIGRYKQTLGARLHAKKLANQQTEVRIGAKILNKMTHHEMPRNHTKYRIAASAEPLAALELIYATYMNPPREQEISDGLGMDCEHISGPSPKNGVTSMGFALRVLINAAAIRKAMLNIRSSRRRSNLFHHQTRYS